VTGTEYLRAIQANQNGCEAATLGRLAEIDPKLPEVLQVTGETLMLLEQYGTCHWGCRGGAHLLERFAARTVSYALASLRLLWFGHYDEAYSLLRTLGELANLLLLFANDSDELRLWRDADESERRNSFGAAAVRGKLEGRRLPLVLTRERFNVLSSRFAHSGQIPAAQLHNPSGVMTTGGYIQAGGLTYGIAQLAVFVATIALALSEQGEMPDPNRESLRSTADRLMTAME